MFNGNFGGVNLFQGAGFDSNLGEVNLSPDDGFDGELIPGEGLDGFGGVWRGEFTSQRRVRW